LPPTGIRDGGEICFSPEEKVYRFRQNTHGLSGSIGGIDIPDLEKHLLEIYGWIKNGTLEVKEHYSVLEVI
jgi:hypothetical protein